MTRTIRLWTPKTEFVVVVLLAFTAPLIGSVLYLTGVRSGLPINVRLLLTAAIEVFTITAVGVILYIRGWNFRDICCKPSWFLTAAGIVLFAVAYVAYVIPASIVGNLSYGAGEHLSAISFGGQSAALALAFSLINPFFEETLVLGYVFVSVERLSDSWTALLISVVIRTLYHLYQGPAGMVGVFSMGVLFAYSFHKTRELWPMLVAHSLWNFMTLTAGH